MATAWDDYLTAAGTPEAYRLCRRERGDAFGPLREVLRRLIGTSRPRIVACLGAGVLNDIPYRALVRSGATIHLVDWLPGAVESGIADSVVRVGGGADKPECVYCDLGDEKAWAYCRNFQLPRDPTKGTCARFASPPDGSPACEAFEKGELPYVHREDVTGGFASAFARGVSGELGETGSWRQALGRANALAKRVRRHRTSLSVPERSADLVISTMVLSQFEHEPYNYFAQQAAARLGRPTPGEERRLKPALEGLRSLLLSTQIERHCDEIERILAPGGVCFVSFETFHFDPDLGRWFLVKEMHDAVAFLAQRFRFDFDLLGEGGGVVRYASGERRSIVNCFVLTRATD
jgi:hypothetical protein